MSQILPFLVDNKHAASAHGTWRHAVARGGGVQAEAGDEDLSQGLAGGAAGLDSCAPGYPLQTDAG
jgi:hypothetical protein